MVTIYIILLVLAAFLLAKLEIQIEGSAGWARNLPTWRKQLPGFELTGYHVYLLSFIFVLMHFPFVFVSWNWNIEMQILSFYLAFWILEDFLWFVLNPGFGLKKFKADYIPWHRFWLGPFPAVYYPAIIFSVLLFYYSV